MTYSDMDPDVQRVRFEVRRFRQHFITFVAVVGVLFIVNLLVGGYWFGRWWFFWIVLIWGVILALEAVHLFGDNIGREWEDRMVDQVLARRRGHPGGAPYRPYTPPSPPSPFPPAAATPAPTTPGVPPAAPPVSPASAAGPGIPPASSGDDPAAPLTPPPPTPII